MEQRKKFNFINWILVFAYLGSYYLVFLIKEKESIIHQSIQKVASHLHTNVHQILPLIIVFLLIFSLLTLFFTTIFYKIIFYLFIPGEEANRKLIFSIIAISTSIANLNYFFLMSIFQECENVFEKITPLLSFLLAILFFWKISSSKKARFIFTIVSSLFLLFNFIYMANCKRQIVT
ncbi:MAG: hypothetical protein LBT69_00835 [Lactobacillales bacterium]|jgi:hypothetical protein|nr:hypothetical protein [Lactobacillales bacterium]